MHVKELFIRLVNNSMEPNKTIALTKYINDNLGFPVQVTGEYLFRLALQHLVIRQLPTEIYIEIDTNFSFYDYKLVTIIDLMECGNIEVSGYPLLTKCCECIKENMEQIYYEWKEGP